MPAKDPKAVICQKTLSNRKNSNSEKVVDRFLVITSRNSHNHYWSRKIVGSKSFNFLSFIEIF